MIATSKIPKFPMQDFKKFVLTYNFIRKNSHLPIELAADLCKLYFNADHELFQTALKFYFNDGNPA